MENCLKNLFTESEWELLCDQCGVCCFYKIEDEDTSEIFYTEVVCPYLNLESGLCEVYPDRFQKMSTCIKISPDNIQEVHKWLPRHCAYRCLYENRGLPRWHPLYQNPNEHAELIRKIESVIKFPFNEGLSQNEIQRIKQNAIRADYSIDFEEQLIHHLIKNSEI